VDPGIDYLGLVHNLLAYFEQPQTCCSVLLPIALSVAFIAMTAPSVLPRYHGLTFVLGTLVSVVFSIHRVLGGEETLQILPGYALVIVLLPRQFQPTWAQAYGLSFLSLILADVWGVATPHLTHGSLPADFYFGIGGAGLTDQLSVGPWLAALPLMLQDWLIRRGIASQPISELTARSYRRLSRRG